LEFIKIATAKQMQETYCFTAAKYNLYCKADIDKIPENVRQDIEFVLVETMDQVIDIALMEKE